MKLIGFHPDAGAEVTEAAQYYEVRKSGLGSDLLVEVERALDQLLTNPEASQRIGRRLRRWGGGKGLCKGLLLKGDQ